MDLSKVSKTLQHGDVWVKTKEENYSRSVHNKALINTNNKALEEYKKAREVRKNNQKQIQQYSDDINSLKTEVNEIKDSLKEILNAIKTKG